ncbi:MAG: SLBB domain-containing protein [Prevotella sp.]|nr:SLBB domain-containing protein [Prevotella sp.]
MHKLLSTSLSIFLLFFSLTLSAQGMSDDQVMKFIIKEHNAGTSQAQIVSKLVSKGVNINQIRRIRKKYEKEIQGKQLGAVADNAVDNAGQMMRQNNGNERSFSRMDSDDPEKERESKYSDDEDDEITQKDYKSLSEKTSDNKEMLFNGNKVFGRDIFNNTSLTFEPAMNIATPQNYVIGPGDNIKLDIYGASQKSDVYIVSPDGDITVEGYGPIHVSGMSVSRAQAHLRSTLGSRYSSSSIKIGLGQTRTIIVNIMGEVQAPGTYTLSAFASVFHALYMAGGISELGTLRNIKVFRRGSLVTVVDVYDYILNGKLTGNVRLQDNDVIVVGTYDAMVSIKGKVKRPMYYEMKKTESLASLLNYAGGFGHDAYRKAIRVIRNNDSKRMVFNVGEFDFSAFKVHDGDDVSVDSIIDRYENMVEVKGAVFRPGMYQLGGEITTVKNLLEQCDGVMEDAITTRGVMHRMNPDRTLSVLSVDIGGILAGTSPDIPLQNEDVLFVPSKTDQQTERTITIHGEVMYPGEYRYADNETLEDFVLQAGGLKESASTVKVDVSRRIIDNKAIESDGITAQNFSFALKDGFVIDGEPGFTLKPYDEVYVRKSPGYQTQQNVYIEGEINFPGTYAMSKRETRLSDIVKAAGGVNALAYVKGARLERKISPEERIRMKQVMEVVEHQTTDEDSLDLKNLDFGDIYYVGIQLDKALEEPGSDYDLVMREGDKIIVPEYNNTVTISGNVLYPNTVAYKKGKKASYYINQAGGYGNRARKRSTYIVHMNGTVNQVGEGEKPTPGCQIIVPTKPKQDPAKVTQWLGIGSTTAAIATTIATVANLIKK